LPGLKEIGGAGVTEPRLSESSPACSSFRAVTVESRHMPAPEAVRVPGIVYIRTTRPKTAVIYDNDEEFPIGGSKTLRASPADRVAIIAAGITLHEALAAHDSLRRKGVHVRVIDAYSIKPLDEEAFARAARETGTLVVVEDHAIDGGLGEAVAAAAGSIAPVHRLGVHELPRSGTENQLLDRHGVSRHAIEAKVLELVS
jgi:transketolase